MLQYQALWVPVTWTYDPETYTAAYIARNMDIGHRMNRGMVYGLGAYLVWGMLPIFWKQLGAVPSLETMAHRVVWSFVLLTLFLFLGKRWATIQHALVNRRVMLTLATTSALLFANWLVYIWAINEERIVETSLGYFINPLVSVLLGVIFLREHLRAGQWVSVLIAGFGVLYLTIGYGHLPWIALVLAFTFGFYGLLRKTASVGSLDGLSIEMGIMTPLMLGYLLYLASAGFGAFGSQGTATIVLLIMTGLATTVPMLLFNMGTRLVPLSVMGLLQYIAPTLQFVLGVAIYQEPFTQAQLAGFCVIWTALFLYAVEGMLHRRRLSIVV